MSEKIKNPIRERLEELKRSMNPKAMFVITSDDKIMYASSSVVKIAQKDPTGSSFVPYIHLKDRSSIKEALEKVESGETTRTMQLGAQLFSVQMTTTREVIDGRVIGLTVINKITILSE